MKLKSRSPVLLLSSCAILSKLHALSLSHVEGLNVWDSLQVYHLHAWRCGLALPPSRAKNLAMLRTVHERASERAVEVGRGAAWCFPQAESLWAWDFATSVKLMNLPVCPWQNFSLQEVSPCLVPQMAQHGARKMLGSSLSRAMVALGTIIGVPSGELGPRSWKESSKTFLSMVERIWIDFQSDEGYSYGSFRNTRNGRILLMHLPLCLRLISVFIFELISFVVGLVH